MRRSCAACARASINELVTRGRLKTVEIGGKPYLYRAEVEAFEPDKAADRLSHRPHLKNVLQRQQTPEMRVLQARRKAVRSEKTGLSLE
jgi:hypothetical protein